MNGIDETPATNNPPARADATSERDWEVITAAGRSVDSTLRRADQKTATIGVKAVTACNRDPDSVRMKRFN